jgi:hypothetical protein
MNGLICCRAVEFVVGENANDGGEVGAEKAEDKSGDEQETIIGSRPDFDRASVMTAAWRNIGNASDLHSISTRDRFRGQANLLLPHNAIAPESCVAKTSFLERGE